MLFAGEMENIQKHKGLKLLRNHIRAMFLKLAYNSTRSKLTTFIQFVSPIINICISVLIARSWKFISELPPLKLTLEDNFRSTETLLSMTNLTKGGSEELVLEQYKANFKDPRNYLTDIGSNDIGPYYLQLVSNFFFKDCTNVNAKMLSLMNAKLAVIFLPDLDQHLKNHSPFYRGNFIFQLPSLIRFALPRVKSRFWMKIFNSCIK